PTGGTVTCSQGLLSAPAPGAPVVVTANGQVVAQGQAAPSAQPLPPPPRASAGALLQPLALSGVDGLANFSPGPSPAQTVGTVALAGLPSGQQATVGVPIGGGPPAPILCSAASASGQAVCSQVLNGTALQGAPVTVVVNGQILAQGPVVPGPQPAAGPAPPFLLPPPPPPGMPPAPPLVPGAATPGVPVIPEADRVALLGLGLLVVAAYRLAIVRRSASMR